MLRPMERSRFALALLAVVAAALAAGGWARVPAGARPTIAIADVRPLVLPDGPSHYFAVRVRTNGWRLQRARPDESGLDARPRVRRWRLYLDGHPVGDTAADIFDTPYLLPGTHWIAAELRGRNHERLRPDVWSEPVVLEVPKTIRCWPVERRLTCTTRAREVS
jgi:hypothetical protein